MTTTTTSKMDAYFTVSRHIATIRTRGALPEKHQHTLTNQAILITDAVIAGTISMEVTALVDYLAQRVETHSPEARRQLVALLENTVDDQRLALTHANLKATEMEAARTALVALGANVDRLVPSDFPALTRAYLVARNAIGALA